MICIPCTVYRHEDCVQDSGESLSPCHCEHHHQKDGDQVFSTPSRPPVRKIKRRK